MNIVDKATLRVVDKAAFGRRVMKRRKALGLSQEVLAGRVGMKQQGIVSIEAGEVERPRHLREIAQCLKTTEEWLLWQRGPENAPEMPMNVAAVPLLSWVSAGKLVSAESQLPVDDVPLLAFADLGRGEFFALKVEGDSMDRLSPEGSIIVVNRAERELLPGRCYVFSVRGETTFKRWHPDPPRLEPYSTNPANQTIFVKHHKTLEVVGRVKRTVLDL